MLVAPTLDAIAARGLLDDIETLRMDRGYDNPRVQRLQRARHHRCRVHQAAPRGRARTRRHRAGGPGHRSRLDSNGATARLGVAPRLCPGASSGEETEEGPPRGEVEEEDVRGIRKAVPRGPPDPDLWLLPACVEGPPDGERCDAE